MTLRVLCTGDIHLGRQPSRIPHGIDAAKLSARAAWERTVETACEQNVDAVCLTGDIVDRENRFFEGYAALASGVKKLANSGIAVLGISGNHDYDVLVRLANEINNFHLLGRGGRWEQFDLQRNGKRLARFWGWSFPAQHVHDSPLASLPAIAGDNVPTIGLVHCDAGSATSTYAPVALEELRCGVFDAWLLGHIHKPGTLCDSPLALYPGSPQGMAPDEPGEHGPWLITFERDRPTDAKQIPLAALRYEPLMIELGEVEDEPGFQSAFIQHLHDLHNERIVGNDMVRAVAVRVQIVGRTKLHRRLPSLATKLRENDPVSLGGVEYFVEKVSLDTRPDVDLSELAKSLSPVGLLARRLTVLEKREPVEIFERLVREGRRAIRAERRRPVFSAEFGEAEPSDDEVAATLYRAGALMLDELLAQKEDHG
jgi:DNA repair exonuclease SbcCD nuclease subunit